MEKDETSVVKHKPLVSIVLITYNHEKYIRQAVDSILSQTMKFSYELIIADDASTDHTQQILAEHYRDIENVKLILREKNADGKNAYLAFQEAEGKYIYVCEGDDYWCGEDGLQRLVDWLENHGDYAGVCGRRVCLSEKTGYMFINYDKKLDGRDISLNDFLERKGIFDRCALLYKNFYHDGKYDYRSYLACKRVGDVTSAIYVLLHGKVHQLDKVVGVYRMDRVKGSSSYNTTHTPQMIFEEHISLISNLDQLLEIKLNYSELKKMYVEWYVASLPSTYEFVKQVPYICKKAGIKITMFYIKKWVRK